jgi:hypothetical protein
MEFIFLGSGSVYPIGFLLVILPQASVAFMLRA